MQSRSLAALSRLRGRAHSPCNRPSTTFVQGADTRRASPSIPPFDILRRSQHAADAIAAISSHSDASRRFRHEITAHEALDVLEGLVLDGVFVPQVALLPTLTLARRSNDAGVLRRTMEITAAAGMLPKDRQIANALVAFARSGDVAGFVAAEREFLQSPGTLPSFIIVQLLHSLFSLGWHDRALSFYDRVRANKRASEVLLSRIVYGVLSEMEYSATGPQVGSLEFYSVVVISARRALTVASTLLRHFCVTTPPSRQEADALLLFCMRADPPFDPYNGDYSARLRNGTAYRSPLNDVKRRRELSIREDNARWLPLVTRALASREFSSALSPNVRTAAIETILSGSGLDRAYHNNEPLVLAYRTAVGHQDELALEQCVRAHVAANAGISNTEQPVVHVWLSGVEREISPSITIEENSTASELVSLLRKRGMSFSDRFRIATKTTVDHLKLLRSEASARFADERATLKSLASGNARLAPVTDTASCLDALSAAAIEDIMSGAAVGLGDTVEGVDPAVPEHASENDDESLFISSMLTSGSPTKRPTWVPKALPPDSHDAHLFFRSSMRIYSPAGSASASTPERVRAGFGLTFAGTTADKFGSSWVPDSALPPSVWAERNLTIALGAYIAAVREETFGLRERGDSTLIVSSLVHESVVCSLVNRGKLTAALQAVRVAGVLSSEHRAAGNDPITPPFAFWAAIGHLFYSAVAIRRLLSVNRSELTALATALLHPFGNRPEHLHEMLRSAEKFHESNDGSVPSVQREVGDSVVVAALRDTIEALKK